MSDLADSLSELVEAHNVAMCGNLGVPGMPDHLELKCPTCGVIPDDGRQVYLQHAAHVGRIVSAYVREHFTDHADDLGLEVEQWVQTPQGTGRPLRPHEDMVLSDRLRGAGWWIETRYSKTVRDA